MTSERDPLADHEAAAAAAEAARIGGTAGDEDLDPAERPVREAGGGEQEGFEQSEELLRENAEHGEHSSALRDGFPAEAEADFASGEYGDADEVVKGSEVVAEEGVPPQGDTDS